MIGLRLRVARDGYSLLPAVIPIHQVDAVRAELLEAMVPERTEVGPRGLLVRPLLTTHLLGRRILEAVVEVLGHGASLFPNLSGRRDSAPDWHIDLGFLTERLDNGPTRFLQAGIYLQDGTSEGGLEVVPGSHAKPAEEVGLSGLLNMVMARRTVPIRPGDGVLWDGRLVHRGTLPPNDANSPKLAMYATFAAPTVPTRPFLRHLAARAASEQPGTDTRRRYHETLAFRWPEMPSSVAERLKATQIRVIDARQIAEDVNGLQE